MLAFSIVREMTFPEQIVIHVMIIYKKVDLPSCHLFKWSTELKKNIFLQKIMKNGFIIQITYLYIHIYVRFIDIYFIFQIIAAPCS